MSVCTFVIVLVNVVQCFPCVNKVHIVVAVQYQRLDVYSRKYSVLIGQSHWEQVV